MTRLHYFLLKHSLKLQKIKNEIKHLLKDKSELPNEWIYIKLREISSDIFKLANINLIVEGIENIPKETCVVYANHQSFLDPLVIIQAHKEFGFILKKELKQEKLIDNIVEITDSLYLDREDTKEGIKTILEAINKIKNGKDYVIFPEGTRNNGELLDFKPGAFKLSLKTNTPICPIAIIGTREAEQSNNMDPCTIKMIILSPIMPDEYKNMNTVKLANLVKSKIENTIKLNS